MPLIQCDIEIGLSDEQKKRLVKRITEVTHDAIGSAYNHINVVIRSIPAVIWARVERSGTRSCRALRSDAP